LGQALIETPAEQLALATYNLQAGRKAIAATAYGPALLYLQTGVSLLGQNSWQTHYNLSRDLHSLSAEAAYLSSELEQMHHHANLVMHRAHDLLEKVKIYEILILYHTAQNEPLKAVTVARDVLALLDIDLPEQASLLHVAQGLIKTRLALGMKDTQALYNLPEMTDPEQLAAMRILMNTISAAYIADPQLFPLIVFNMVQLGIHLP
jgi:predicted ATPase